MKDFIIRSCVLLAISIFTISSCSDDDESEETLVEICDNLKDDDGDGFTDCEDNDCSSDATCVATEICDNGVDDDANGFTDCDDIKCSC